MGCRLAYRPNAVSIFAASDLNLNQTLSLNISELSQKSGLFPIWRGVG